MRSAITIALATAAALGLARASQAQAAGPIDPTKAAAAFHEAAVVCARDGGKLWGRSLCGPILFVAPETREVVANQADRDGALTPSGPVFTGKLPEETIISNSPTQWSGTLWTQLIWPYLPTDPAARRVMFAHELFHHIQGDLKGPGVTDGDNRHLDSLEGRYWLQLEWRALAKALDAKSIVDRKAAIADALTFRAERYRRFPAAAQNEQDLELNEGVAEYTGVRVGLETPQARTAFAIRDLSIHVPDDSLVRSFAYATGPAYGLLLDSARPGWRHDLKSGRRWDQMLQSAFRIALPPSLPATALTRAKAYDDGSLRMTEVARDAVLQKRLAGFRVRLVDGPVLILPLAKSNRQFRPSTLAPLGDLGVVYPTLRLTAPWGALEVSGGVGALLGIDMQQATVSLMGADRCSLKGEGWTLKLNPGWSVRAGARAEDRIVAADPSTPDTSSATQCG